MQKNERAEFFHPLVGVPLPLLVFSTPACSGFWDKVKAILNQEEPHPEHLSPKGDRTMAERGHGKVRATGKYQDKVNKPIAKAMSSMAGSNLDLDDYMTKKALKGLFSSWPRKRRFTKAPWPEPRTLQKSFSAINRKRG
ncbi:MAG: hypothetical protein DRI92_01755 [Aquificota bacterium]|nr:MAG: hypothetical protein DRI92_01755 [Aquificota bacterium]